MTEPQFANLVDKASSSRVRIRAVAMQLVCDENGRYVELHIVTDRGQTLVVACDDDSIFALQRHIQDTNPPIWT